MEKMMRWLLIVFVLLSLSTSVAFAGPYAVTGEFDSTLVTTCVFVMNGGEQILTTPTAIDWENTILRKNDINYFTHENMIFRNVYGVNRTMSKPSAQVITFAVIPDKPVWKGIDEP